MFGAALRQHVYRAPALTAMLMLAIGMPSSAASFRERGTPVAVAVYDFEVAVMCGLADGAVQRGFRHHLDALVLAAGLDRQAFEQARMRGWAAAEREWANRGLGGFRGWCRDEGAAAAAVFTAHDPASAPAGPVGAEQPVPQPDPRTAAAP